MLEPKDPTWGKKENRYNRKQALQSLLQGPYSLYLQCLRVLISSTVRPETAVSDADDADDADELQAGGDSSLLLATPRSASCIGILHRTSYTGYCALVFDIQPSSVRGGLFCIQQHETFAWGSKFRGNRSGPA